MELPRMALPKMAKVRQALPQDHITDIGAEVRQQLERVHLQEKLKPGQQVAITAGSRGMGSFLEIAQAIVAQVKACGAQPFVVPAMGSHGGATAEGQRKILAGYGLTEAALDCPVRSSMETVQLGQAENGAQVHFDRNAYQASATIVLGRCKTHPILHEGNGSGILKMITIGLGKQAGAQEAHSHGLAESVQQVPKVALAKANILLGVNVIENGYRQPYRIEAVEPDDFWEADQRGMELARTFVARIPFERLDLLVVSYIGKDISGGGMDPNVTGFWRANGMGQPIPAYRRIVVLDLTEGTQGNALGVGQADFTTRRLVDKIDRNATFINMLTAAGPDGRLVEAEVPMAFDCDRDALEIGLRAAVPQAAPRVCWIKDTAELGEIWVSEGLLAEVNQNPQLQVLSQPQSWTFDQAGNTQWH